MIQKLQLAVVGAGKIFRNAHLPAWLAHPEVEILAICDTNKTYAEQLAEEHGIPYVYTDYRELLQLKEIDIVDICTPNLFHSEISIAALQAGKHVFCEKPDAINPEEAQKMADAAAVSGKVMMAMRNNRFRAESQYLNQYIEEGHMGEIYMGRCGWIRRRGIPGQGGWFTTKELSGGGPLIDLGVHMLDLSVWLMGNPKPVSVSGATYRKFAGSSISDSEHSDFGESRQDGIFDVEDLAAGFIRFENGSTLQIEFSWASNIEEEMNFVEFRGTKAGASLRRNELKIFTETTGRLTDLKPLFSPVKQKPHALHLQHFVDVVRQRAEPINKPEHGVDMIKMLSALYRSAETGVEVRL
jgi:predicted dehydrogenase